MYIQLILFLAGAVVMSLEITAGRLFAPYFGSTIYVWGSLIGVVLVGLSAGYFLGGKFSDLYRSRFYLRRIVLLSGFSIVLIPYLSPRLLPFFSGFDITYGPLIASVTLLGIPCIFLGMVPPFVLRLKVKKINLLGTQAGYQYFISALGSIAGTFFTTFFLIPSIGTTNILLSIGIILICVYFFGSENKWIIFPLILVIIVLVPTNMIRINNSFAGAVNRLKYETIYETDTAYYHLVVAEDKGRREERVLFLDNLKHSSMILNNTNETKMRYPYYFHSAFSINPDINDVLFVGGGGMSSPKNFLQEYDNISIDVVEIDPEVVRIAKEYFAVPDDSRLHIHVKDARQFLKTSPDYDLIVLDAYSGEYVPFHLMTQEFFILTKEKLDTNGVVAFNMVTAIEGELSELFRYEYKTIRSVFENVYVIPLLGADLPGNVIILASDSEKVKDSEYFKNLYDKEISTNDEKILTDDFAPVNLINPLRGRKFQVK
ncbi:hypothetical protein GF327_08850 [Candidatus Woesearchaeota archaeon]|nr:hypothetical protein [Candidatus Woesearchaeota archaeon]